MKPKDRIPESTGDSWYANTPLGHNTLGKFLKEILKEGHVQAENKSNHSLQSTAITRMFENKVADKLILERSGHLSVGGLHSYERSTMAQVQDVCKSLQSVPSTENDAEDSGKTSSTAIQDDCVICNLRIRVVVPLTLPCADNCHAELRTVMLH